MQGKVLNPKKKTSINRKFFVSMSVLSITFILVLLTTTSAVFYERLFEIEKTSSIRQLSYISDLLNHYLESVDNYSKTIMIDSTIQTYMAKYNASPENLNAMDQMSIKQKINHIIQSTPFIHSVSLYSPDKALIATTEIYPYEADLDIVSNLNTVNWIPRLKYSNVNRSITLHALSLLRPFYNYKTGDLQGYMEIAIPESTISNIYTDKSNSVSRIFIIDSSGIVQSTDGSKEISSTFSEFKQEIIPLKDHSVFSNKDLVFSKYFPALDWYIVNEVNVFHLLQPTFATFGISLIVTILCILSCLYVSLRLSKTITSPIYRLISHTQKIKEGDWKPVNDSSNYSDIGLLFEGFNSMIIAQEDLKNNLLDSEKAKNIISLELLQQQINPHFLYNTLDNICSIAEIDEKETLIDLVMNLSNFYRQGLSNGLSQVTIEKELEITKAYLEIMKIRYHDRFDYLITCPENLLQYTCLKLLLQPIVENSIYHGIKELDGRGMLEIRVTETETAVVFTILDNGVGLRPEAYNKINKSESGHFGIKNISQRVKLYYGDEYGLSLNNRPGRGCIAVMTIGKVEVNTNAL